MRKTINTLVALGTIFLLNSGIVYSETKKPNCNYSPVCTIFRQNNQVYQVSKDRAWNLGRRGGERNKMDSIPKIPSINRRILRVAEIVEEKGNVIDSPYWNLKELRDIKEPGYTKQVIFPQDNKTYCFSLDNYNETVLGGVDLLQVQVRDNNKKTMIIYGDAGLDGILDLASNEHGFNEKPRIYKLKSPLNSTKSLVLRHTSQYFKTLKLFLAEYNK